MKDLSQIIRESAKLIEKNFNLCRECATGASDTFETVPETCVRCGTHLGTRYLTPQVLFCWACGEQFAKDEEYIALTGTEWTVPVPQWHVRCYKPEFAREYGVNQTVLA